VGRFPQVTKSRIVAFGMDNDEQSVEARECVRKDRRDPV
jgi:hypothetical protein